MLGVRRREFITLLGGAAAAWPFAAQAQPVKSPIIGVLGASTPSVMGQWTAGFVQRLRELGWIEGRTIAIEVHWAEGRSERYTEIAACRVRGTPCRRGVQRCRPAKVPRPNWLWHARKTRPEKKCSDGLVTIPVQA